MLDPLALKSSPNPEYLQYISSSFEAGRAEAANSLNAMNC